MNPPATVSQNQSVDIAEEDRLRASVYALLARYLRHPPDAEALAAARALMGDESELGEAFSALGTVARVMNVEAVDREYHALFIGLGRGELLPYGSYYLTGFLNEKPLAKLRASMATLGIERLEGIKEPEDHIGSLMEMMAGLILGSFGPPLSIAEQRAFFSNHIEPWAPYFFKDLEAAKGSVFYLPVATVGRVFMEIEEAAFSME